MLPKSSSSCRAVSSGESLAVSLCSPGVSAGSGNEVGVTTGGATDDLGVTDIELSVEIVPKMEICRVYMSKLIPAMNMLQV